MNNLPNITEILINTFQTLINQFVDFVPKLIGAIVIMAIGVLVAKSVAAIVSRVLKQVGFDRIGDKLNDIDVIRQLQTEIKLSEIVAKVLYYFILLVFITAATETLGIAAITNMVLSLVNFIPKLVAAAIMLQIGVLLADALKKAVISICQTFKVASGKLLGMIVFFFFLIITIISALGQAGINTELLESSFNLLVGGIIFAFAVGYGIASRDVMANILSSFYSKNRFKEGQIIQIEEVKGTIISIDNTSLTLQTGETTTIIPLQALQSQKVQVF
ncbi:mechanosensitive ion channel [Rudanella paleaurantiibacter]|uniref:Mechanosensitive ion channel n=1 Tax=Rudanella paleaurantiibacter TaxID=2614655 RepID=A0A7J5U323_9BACT|nr:mechanosensitive ion channel [Rudanella paleaurantiibacter]KAB7732199.1 mechanosensitive ion channel [Rudanella paleaurantiibacter]